MNILMIGPSRKLKGGVATVVNNYMNSDLNKKCNIEYVKTVEKNGIINKIISALGAYNKIFYRILFKKIDIIHIHLASRGSFYRKSFIIILARIFNKKIIVHMHGAEFNEFYHHEAGCFKKKIISKILNSVEIIIALSSKWEEDLKKITKTKIIVLHNCVKCTDRNLYNSDSKNIIFLGRVNKRKGALDILDIAKEIFDIYPNYRLLLCGDGNLEQINNIIKKNDICESVKVLGWIDGKDMEKVTDNAVINILPSYNEGLPMSILEAMSKGIPTIASNVGGIPDVIKDNNNGILIEPGDKELLKENIIKLISNESMRKIMSDNAFKTISESFNIEKNILKLEAVYKSLIEI